MRRSVSLMLAALMLLTLLAAAVPAFAADAKQETKIYYVACKNGGDLNLRDTPSKNGHALVKIPYGTKLEIKTLSKDKQWGKCKYNGFEGWVMLSFLSEKAPDMSNSQAHHALENEKSMNNEFKAMSKNVLAEPYQVIVSTAKTTAAYHLRWAPYISAYSMRSDVMNGEVFTVTAEGSKWLQVIDNQSGRTAYIVRNITQPWYALEDAAGE